MDGNTNSPRAAAPAFVARGFGSKEEHESASLSAMNSLLSGLQKLSLRERRKFNDPDAAARDQRAVAQHALNLVISAALNAGASPLETRPFLDIVNALDRVEGGGDPPLCRKPASSGARYPVSAVDASRREGVVLLLEIYRAEHMRRTGKKLQLKKAAKAVEEKLVGYDPEQLFDAYSRDEEKRKFRMSKLEAKTIVGYRAAVLNTEAWDRINRLVEASARMPLEKAEAAALMWATSGESELPRVRALLADAEPGEAVGLP
jgi:hypothetical protein